MISIKLTTEQSRVLFYLLHRVLFSGESGNMKSAERSTLTEVLATLTEDENR